ncbi:MAG: ABC transporter ATP-binding protein [Magnetococcales bacterium]|nr:ABC transporter ATP-binding protein [Magnetococcales bacterium]
MAMDAFDIVDVTRRYGSLSVLAGLKLRVREGSSFGLVGGNGAGKTTLIKCILDLCRPDTGTIRIFGTASTRVEARRRVAYLPERFLPPSHLQGREFLASMILLHGQSVSRTRMEETVAALDMDPSALRKPVHTLSKGMTQKLGLAACLLSGKDLLVLDEPTSGLDPLARALFKEQLRERQRQGHTLFINTHILADVENLCDTMAILHHGRLLFLGTPTRCREQFGGDSLENAYLNAVRTLGQAA